MKISPLKFSESFCDAKMVTDAYNFQILQVSIVINASDTAITINGDICRPWRSIVCNNTKISGSRIIVITLENISSELAKFPHDSQITNNWSHVYDIFKVDALRKVDLWRSEKDLSIDGIELNLWYAPQGVDCGIHNTHDFLELHTQVYGLGIMQKFRENKHETIYREVFMPVGLTHEPFCDARLSYPWHQYKCVSDCIWLAIEFHNPNNFPISE